MQSKQIPIDQIQVGDRQRSQLKDIEGLKASISARGLLHPLTVQRIEDGQFVLIAGRRRLEALKELGHKKAPCRYLEELDALSRRQIEFEENIRREDLHWKDHVAAIANLANEIERQAPDISDRELSERINFDRDSVRMARRVKARLDQGDQSIEKCSSFSEASKVEQRRMSRELENEASRLSDDLEKGLAPIDSTGGSTDGEAESQERQAAEGAEPQPALASSRDSQPSQVTTADFLEWAASYSGAGFNVIHCDFPFGIKHARSDTSTRKWLPSYADTEDIYWQLVLSLADNLTRLAQPQCHIFFWFSMNYYSETVQFFEKECGLDVVPHPLVWHKTDNQGIASDYRRRPRHVYETLLLMSRGDRNIISPFADAYAAPSIPSHRRSHVSEKPVPMLKHFLSLVTDDLAEFLDPTCGTGSSLVAANALGARRIVGVEKEPDFAARADAALKEEQNKHAAHRKLLEGRGV